MKKKIHFIDTQYRKLCYSYLYPIRDIKQKRYKMYWTKERVKAEHEPNMIGKKKNI